MEGTDVSIRLRFGGIESQNNWWAHKSGEYPHEKNRQPDASITFVFGIFDWPCNCDKPGSIKKSVRTQLHFEVYFQGNKRLVVSAVMEMNLWF